MKKPATIAIIVFAVIIGLFVAGPFFVVNEGELAVVVQMGRIVNVVTDAGLHFKVPIIDEVHRFPRKIMTWDAEPMLLLTAEGQRIFVDVTARWRISDTQRFYESVRSVDEANRRLTNIIDSAVRTVIAENPMRESVRNSNIIMERPLFEEIEDDIFAEVAATFQTEHVEIARGRRQLAEEMLERSRVMTPEFGINLIDVVIRQIRYSDELTPSVFARMIRERNQLAQAYRSDGEGRRAEWLGRMEHETREMLSYAFARSQTIMGGADAEAARIYAEAFNQNQSFFQFWRAMESYRVTLPNFRTALSTDLEYFRFLFSPQ